MSTSMTRSAATKSVRRTWIVDQILEAMTGDDIFQTLDYRHKKESYIKQYMHQPLKTRLIKIHRRLAPNAKEDTLKHKAADSLLWEGDVKTTINHIRFLGAQHRPDFVVKVDGLSIAVEVKRGQSGAAVREGVGQSLVYAASEDFDFVVSYSLIRRGTRGFEIHSREIASESLSLVCGITTTCALTWFEKSLQTDKGRAQTVR